MLPLDDYCGSALIKQNNLKLKHSLSSFLPSFPSFLIHKAHQQLVLFQNLH